MDGEAGFIFSIVIFVIGLIVGAVSLSNYHESILKEQAIEYNIGGYDKTTGEFKLYKKEK